MYALLAMHKYIYIEFNATQFVMCTTRERNDKSQMHYRFVEWIIMIMYDAFAMCVSFPWQRHTALIHQWIHDAR